MLAEYVPFIVLLFSLYTISGGIRLEGDLPAHPLTNTAFLAVGGVLASFIGTTGAAMLLIRPLLETNRERKHVKHTVVFFIFIVCNCGGCLLPIGDPPLFLGYLLGVPFLWTLVLWKEWLFVNGCLLVIYYVWDRFCAIRKERAADVARDETAGPPAAVRRAVAERLLAAGRDRSPWRCWIPASRCPAPTGIPGCTCAKSCSWRWWPVAGCWAASRSPRGQQLQLRRDHRSGRAVLRHLHLHAAAAADPATSAGRASG